MTEITVRKKDGREVVYREAKILNDLDSAERVFKIKLKESKNILAKRITEKVRAMKQPVQTEDIFAIVEEVLAEEPAVLSAFREFKKNQQIKMDNMTNIDYQIQRLENKDKDVVNENGNRDSRRFSTQRELLSGVISRAKGLNMFPEHVKRAHIKGSVYQHDLDKAPYSAQPNCSLIDFDYLLKNGFKLGDAWIYQPQSFGVAVTVIVQCLGEIAGTQFGGMSIHEIDKVLEPYAEKSYQKNISKLENLLPEDINDRNSFIEEKAIEYTIKEIKDGAQSLEFEINTMTTSSAQVPFTTISFGLSEGKWGREIQKAILQQRYDGLSDGSTAIFPKQLYFLKDGHNLKKGDPFYDVKKLAMKTSARRTYPDMVSMKQLKELRGTEKAITAMGCRSYLNPWFDPETGVETYAGRANGGVSSLNLVRIGIESRGDMDFFYEILNNNLDILKDALKIREQRVMNAEIEQAPLMYKYGGMGKPKETVREYFCDNRGTISVGYVGLHNCMVAITGEVDWIKNKAHRKTSVDIMKYIQKYVDDVQDEFDMFLSVYGSPAESLATKFCELDIERFGVIDGVNDRGYYENSFHFPSYLDSNPFDKINLENKYLPYTLGGNMIYVESTGLEVNLEAFEIIWDYMYENILYGGINNPLDNCFECGFEGEFLATKKGYECPNCKNNNQDTIDVVRRLCGYLGSVVTRPVISGKDNEIKSRVDHT